MLQKRFFNQQQSSPWWIDFIWLTLILGGLFFILLGTRPLFVPDEGRYAEIAREMVASGDYVTPYLNSIKYFEKPIFFYWLASAAIKIGGLNLWSIRSVNALLGLLGCFFTYYAGRKLYDRLTGFLAALILGTSTLYFIMAHTISLDLTVTFFLASSLYCFLLGISSNRPFYFWAAAAAAALAVLTKGLIGLLFPLMIIGSWLLLLNQWYRLKKIPLLTSFVIFFLIAAPWHLIVGHRHPEFYFFYFVEQHFMRYTTKNIGHYQPVWFFIPYFLIGFFPWSVFLPQTLKKIFAEKKISPYFTINMFFLLWAILIFLFFSFSESKLIPYILPIFPPIAILTAHYLREISLKTVTLSLKISYFCLLLVACMLIGIFFGFIHQVPLPDANKAYLGLGSAGIILLLGIGVSIFYLNKNRLPAIFSLIISMSLFLLCLLATMPAIDDRTILPLATMVKPLLKPQDEIVSYKQYYQDLPFYLQKRVTVVSWSNELAFGMQHQSAPWMLDEVSFWQQWDSPKRIYALMRKEDYEILREYKHLHLVGETLNNVLVRNGS